MSYLNSVATASSRTLVKLVAALVFLLSLIVPAFAGEFQAHVDYTTGLDPASVAIGDFNRDKKVDVVVGNYDDDTESIFLGNGDGSFQPQLVFPSGTCPLWMTVVDINEDGIQDLIVTDHDSNTVSVIFGNGDGSFQLPVQYPTGVTPLSVVVADFNGDSILDMAVANASDKTISVLFGNGDGTFQPKVDYPTGATVLAIATGDVNGDTKPDLIVANYNINAVGVFIGNGNGTFQPVVNYATGNRPNSVTVVDLNKDGKLDLVTANYDATSSSISILLGNGTGSFTTHVELPVGPTPKGPYSAVPGDVNGDGKIDLVTANGNGNSVSVLLSNGDGTFQTHVEYPVVGSAKAVAVQDLNQDGAPDLAVPNGENTLSILLNTGGTFIKMKTSANPSQFGQPVTFTTRVTASLSGVGSPTGTVTFRDGTTVLGIVDLINGQASLTTSTLSVGNHRIQSRYSGDTTFNPHISAAFVQVVQ
ncbi:MAG TPA: FG-GAP-like repeat-containing protein [Terriglobales bacterium]|jgi:hypothetical protein